MRADDQPAGFRELVGILSFRKWSVILVTLLVVGIALAYSFRQEPTYQSSAEVLIQPVNFDPSLPPNTGFVNMPTEQRIAISSPVATEAAKRLGSQGIAVAAISVEALEGANALVFEATSTIPASAQATAQTFAESYLEFREKGVLKDLLDARRPIEQRIRGLNREVEDVQERLFGAPLGQTEAERAGLQVQFNSLLTQRADLQARLNELIAPEFVRIGEVLAPAFLPTTPSSPNHIRTGAFALFVGISLGVGLAFLRERMDERVRDRGDLEPTMGLPVLAAIPAARVRRRRKEILTWSKPNSDVAEAYKGLRSALMVSASREGWRSLIVTSATPGEGKTFTIANVAVALAHSDVKVILVSADTRKPGLRDYLHQANRVGLANLLAGSAPVEAALSEVQGVRNLRVLGVGSVSEWNPPTKSSRGSAAEHLGSKTMGEIVASLSGLADMVLIDTPPVLGIADTLALAPLVDATLMVVDAERVTRGVVREALHRLEGVEARVIGAVLTRYDPARSRAYYASAGYATPSRAVSDSDGARHGFPIGTTQTGSPTVPEALPSDVAELPSRHEP